MGSGLISIAMTGINAAQAGLLTTGNNISNLSTEGYTRQRTIQASNPSVMTGAGGIGQGVHVVTVERMFSQALTTQVLNAQTNVSALDTYYAQVSQIDNMLADKEAGLTPAMQEFFNSVQSVATNPSSISARQSMVSAAETMTTSFRSMYERLTEIEAGINSQVKDTVGLINTYSAQIADLNEKIISAGAIGGQPANDLYDKRDKLVADLNELVKVTVTSNTNGSYNVFVGSGQQLVVGSQVTRMSAEPASADRSRNVIGLVGATGNIQELPESLISGGKLGGLLSFRSEALDASFNQLGLMATSFTQTFNAQHTQGLDLFNNAGSAFFSVGAPDVIPNTNNASGSPTVSIILDPVTSNTTNYYSNLTASDYRLSYGSGAQPLTLTRLSDNTSWSGTSELDINTQLAGNPQGFTLSFGVGTFVNGDSYLIQPTRDAARHFAISGTISADPRLIAAGLPAGGSGPEDGRNIVKLGNLQTQNTMLGAKATYQDNYAAFVNDVGNKAASAEISSVAQTSLLKQAVAAREAVSGVNKNEEAAKLIEYQQAYQASAKVIEIASNLFDTLLSIGR